MEAVSYLAPALAPLAIKLIDKYIFDDQPAPVPQIIQIPASPRCACRCGQQFTDDYYSTDGTCSTCTANSSSSSDYHSKRHRLSTKSSTRSSSTSNAHGKNSQGKERSKATQRSRSARRVTDDNSDGNTLQILAANLKKEISARHSNGKSSSRGSESRSTEKSSSKYKSHSSTRKSSGKSVHESKSMSRKSNDSDGSNFLKAGCGGC